MVEVTDHGSGNIQFLISPVGARHGTGGVKDKDQVIHLDLAAIANKFLSVSPQAAMVTIGNKLDSLPARSDTLSGFHQLAADFGSELLLTSAKTGERVEDATDTALALQADNQQRYDLYLYRTSIEHRRNQIGSSILGQSAAIEHIIQTVQQLSHVPSATVLLMGETGTGKNLTARIIHESAMPAESPFVEINGAALPEQLIEAELFGYDKGAFTHAVSAKPGLLEAAHGGTLFLDEIGELPINLQAKLLSTIESKTFRRLGSKRQRQVNLRIIAATNRDLRMEITQKTFREDLFYRLNVVSITLPPLRELGEDIVLIGERFVELLNIQFSKKVKGFSPAARNALLANHWPGNVRDLSNCIERAMIFINGD